MAGRANDSRPIRSIGVALTAVNGRSSRARGSHDLRGRGGMDRTRAALKNTCVVHRRRGIRSPSGVAAVTGGAVIGVSRNDVGRVYGIYN